MDTNESPIMIPYVVHESEVTRLERHNRRWFYVVIVLLVMFFCTNFAWLYIFYQYDYSATETVTIDGQEGIANYIGNDGTITNGKDNSEENP